MIVVQLNTALQEYQFRHEKCVQDYLEYEAISGVILGEGGYNFDEYEIVADCYLFMASGKADAEAAIPLYVSGREDYSLSGVWNGWEMIRI